MIKVENVSFKYKNNDNKILDDISFSVNDGEILAIVGQNGSGKSTIGKLIAGIIKLKHGNIFVDDLEIKDNSKLIKDKIGIVFQNPENQIIFNNIYDELAFSLKGISKEEIENRINIALEEVGMLKYKNSDLYTLSLGQKQRIMIAEVLVKKPKYIIFDEPTTMIDSQGKEAIYDIIRNLKKEGYTIICITNVADEILIADRTLILNNGTIACEINKENLIEEASILKKFNIKEPIILEFLNKLKESNISLDINDFTIDELVNKLKGKIKNEECN